MELAKPGEIKNFCQQNDLLTFDEYLLDYNPKLAQKIKALITSEIRKIPDPNVRKLTSGKMEPLIQGARDIYF